KLEALEPCSHGIAESSVGVEDDGVVLDTAHTQEGIDLALRLQEKRRSGGAHRQLLHVLTQLALQERQRVGTRYAHEVPREPDSSRILAQRPVVLGEVRQGPASSSFGGQPERRRAERRPWPGTRRPRPRGRCRPRCRRPPPPMLGRQAPRTWCGWRW